MPFKSRALAAAWVSRHASGTDVLVYWTNQLGETCWATFRRFALPQWVLWETGTMRTRQYA